MIAALLWLFNTVILLYIVVLLVLMILSWLIAFKAINAEEPLAAQVNRGLIVLTNPVRRIVPTIGGLDFSPIIVALLLEFLRRLVDNLVATG